MRKTVVSVLIFVMLLLLGAISWAVFSPETFKMRSKETVARVQEARRPPPRPTPRPTATAIPTPSSPKIDRRIRVSPDSFPFKPAKPQKRDDGTLCVTLEVKNNTDRDWPVAYLILSSAYHPARPQYRLDNWKRHEVRSVDYVFPASELKERMSELRVEDVSEVPDTLSALGITKTGVPSSSVHREPGVVSMWGSLKGAVGVPPPSSEDMVAVITENQPELMEKLKEGTGLSISLEGLGDVDLAPIEVGIGRVGMREAQAATTEGLKSAALAIEAIRELGRELSARPYADVMGDGGKGREQIEQIRRHEEDFFKHAIAVKNLQGQSKSNEMQPLLERLDSASRLVITYKSTLERQVRAARPTFSLDQ